MSLLTLLQEVKLINIKKITNSLHLINKFAKKYVIKNMDELLKKFASKDPEIVFEWKDTETDLQKTPPKMPGIVLQQNPPHTPNCIRDEWGHPSKIFPKSSQTSPPKPPKIHPTFQNIFGKPTTVFKNQCFHLP